MTKFRSFRSALLVFSICVAAYCSALRGLAHGQYYFPNRELRISDLPTLTAKSKDPSDVLVAAVQIIFHDAEVCCSKNSALEDDVQRPDPKSLKDIAAKLQGRHLLSDSRPIMVTADYVPADQVNPGQIVGALREKRLPLIEWDSRMYVLYGAIFDETSDPETGTVDAIHKLFLLDVRFSDARREITFNRDTDDWGKVQGLLMLKAAPQ